MSVQTMDDIRELAQQLRVDSIRCSTSAGSGHPTSSMSAADVMAVLLARHFPSPKAYEHRCKLAYSAGWVPRCPLWIRSGHEARLPGSAFPPKADVGQRDL
jgi:hypothetical protein